MRDSRAGQRSTATIALFVVIAAAATIGALLLDEAASESSRGEEGVRPAASASSDDAASIAVRAPTSRREATVAPRRVDVAADVANALDAGAESPAEEPLPAPSLVIRVTYRDAPVFEGLRVLFLRGRDWNASPERRARRDGTFVYRRAPVGRYRVAVLAEELLLAQREIAVVEGRTNEVTIELPRPVPDAETIAASAATGTVRGTLIGRSDARYDGLRVAVEPRAEVDAMPGIVDLRDAKRRREFDVDATGRFQAEGVGAGLARLELVLPDSVVEARVVATSDPTPAPMTGRGPSSGIPGSRIDLGDVVVPADGVVDVAYDFVDRLPGRFRFSIEGGDGTRDDLIFSATMGGAEPRARCDGNVSDRAETELGPVRPGRWDVTILRSDWSYAMPGPIRVVVPPGGVARVVIAAADLYAPVRRDADSKRDAGSR